MEVRVSLDNLTFVGVPRQKVKVDIQEIVPLEFYKNHWITAHAKYHDNFILVDGVFIQITHHSEADPSMRIEFNPNQLDNFKSLMVQKLVGLMSDIHITRRDVAIDILSDTINLGDYYIVDKKTRKGSEFRDRSNRLETKQYGSRQSDVVLRIYNKWVEQGIKEKERDPKYWWRVEAQMRGDYAMNVFYNPFDEVRIFKDVNWDNMKLNEKMALFYLIHNPDALEEMSSPSKAKYRKMLEENVLIEKIPIKEWASEELENLASDTKLWAIESHNEGWKERSGFRKNRFPITNEYENYTLPNSGDIKRVQAALLKGLKGKHQEEYKRTLEWLDMADEVIS